MDNNLGNIIKNARARAVIYGVYVIAGLFIGALQVGFAAIAGVATPEWLAVALAVYGYLGIPLAGLAAANSSIIPQTVVSLPEATVTIDSATVSNPETGEYTSFTH